MRGGAQAHLVEAADGCFYVLKARNNPQHARILVNEWVCSVFLRFLQLNTPEAVILEVDADFQQATPALALHLGTKNVPVETGWHFGSRYPGDPDRVAVFDFLPDALLPNVGNHRELLGMYVFDQWVANGDSRQAIFYRAQLRLPRTDETPAPARAGFVASFIDHGFAFQGPRWEFRDAPLQGVYHRRQVYHRVKGWDDFEPWLSRIEHFPPEVIDEALRQVPLEWSRDDRTLLEATLDHLLRRRGQVRRLVEAARGAGVNLFPNWS
jgi:hypothetical protein